MLIRRSHAGMAGIAAADWDALGEQGQPFLAHAFLDAAERHGAVSPRYAWQPHHLTWEAHGKLLAALPLYLRTHSFGDFSADWRWPASFAQAGVPYYPKAVTGIPYTPVSGPRLLLASGPGMPEIGVVLDGLQETLETLGVSTWQCLFVDPAPDLLAAMTARKVLLRQGVQFHWHNAGYATFDDFLAQFAADKRKKVRRERRRVAEAGLRLETRLGDEIDPLLWQDIHRHYATTFGRYGNHPVFTPAFFAELGQTMGRRLVVQLAFAGERAVASAICYRNGRTLYGRHWGADAAYHSLHFELCLYQGIDYCIRHGLQVFEPGAQGEHKVSRGFLPMPTWSAFWVADPRMRAALGDYFAREAAAIDHYGAELRQHAPYRNAPDARAFVN